MNRLVIHPSPAARARTDVVLGRRAAQQSGEHLGGAPLVLLVVDQALAEAPIATRVRGALEGALQGTRIHESRVRATEEEKSIAACERLWDAWTEAGAGRGAVVVALGGGLVSDVAGFAASAFHRGLAWIVVPTTTLSMADAAIGGKTAVNLRAGKNLVGAVHHPRAVLADLDALEGLPPEAFADGFAEVVKAALVGDAALLDLVESEAPRLRARDVDAAGPCLFRALRVKAEVVEADAQEESRREILNFGHTVAHAIEHATRHAVTHGRAVAAGIVAESLLAERLGRLPAGTARRAGAACDAVGVPWKLESLPSRDALVAAMRRDKKSRAGVVRVALPTDLGTHDASPGVAVDPEELVALLAPP